MPLDWLQQGDEATVSADAFVGEQRPKKRSKSVAPKAWAKVRAEVDAMNEVGGVEAWANATPLQLLAILEDAHLDVYGVAISSTGGDRRKASGALAGYMKRASLDARTVYQLLLWAWDREKKTEEWRRANNSESTYRLTWEKIVSGRPYNDYQVALSRKSR